MNGLTLTALVACSATLARTAPPLAHALHAQDPASILVSAAPVERVDIEHELVLFGSLRADRMTLIHSRVTGYLAAIPVEEGDLLEAGATLARIAVPDLEADLAEAEADLTRSEALADDARAGVLEAHAARTVAAAAVDQRRAGVAVKAAELEVLALELERVRALTEGGAETRRRLEMIEGDHRIASARKDAAGADLAAAEAAGEAAGARLNAAEAGVASATAAIAAAAARRDRLAVEVGFATIRAPYGGARVSRRHLDEGQLVRAGVTLIAEVVDSSRVRVTIFVPEPEAPLIRSGMTASVLLDAYPGDPIGATLTRSSGAIDPRTRTMRAEIELDNSDGRMMAGMTCRATLTVAVRAGAMVVPGSAINIEGRQAFVLVIEGGRAVRKDVEVGRDDGLQVEVLSGLTGTEQVIRARPAGLEAGDAVRIADAGAPR